MSKTKDPKGSQPKDRAQELVERLWHEGDETYIGPDTICISKHELATLLRKEFEQEKALVVEGCASILQIDIDMYSRFAARSNEPTSTQEAKRAADLCGYRDAIRSSHPNLAAIKAEIEREAIERVKCSCPPRCDVTMAGGVGDLSSGSHSIMPPIEEMVVEIGGKCPMHKALEALQPKEEGG